MSGQALPVIDEAIAFILQWGQVEGAHHKAWVIDQVLRILLSHSDDYYASMISDWKADHTEPDDVQPYIFWTEEWDSGIAP